MKKRLMINYFDVSEEIPYRWVFENIIIAKEMKENVLYCSEELVKMFKKYNKTKFTIAIFREMIYKDKKFLKYRVLINNSRDVFFGLPKTIKKFKKLKSDKLKCYIKR